MQLSQSYIVNSEGKPTAVIIDYETYTKLREILADVELGKAMEEVTSDEETSLEEAKRPSRFRGSFLKRQKQSSQGLF